MTGRLLDFGCGRKPYRNLFSNVSEYIGIDIENPAHDHKKEEIDYYYDGVKTPFENNSFDNIFCSEVLEHVPNPEIILPEMNRILKKSGKLLITVPFVWNEHEMPFDYLRYSTNGLKQLLEKNSFQILSITKTSHFIEVIWQLWLLYIYELFYSRNKYVRIIVNVFLIFPFTVIGVLVSFIFPRIKSLYFNTIILAEKVN